MIGAVTSTAQTAYTSGVASNARTTSGSQAAAETAATEVNLSPGGKLLASLSSLIIDPKVHMANAEKRLNELMGELGIPPDTEIDIHLSNSGQFTVSGDHPKLQALQDMLNDGSERDLHNSLIGAHTATIIHECAVATEQTSKRVEANPQAAETLWTQLIAEAERIGRQSADFSFSGSKLSGSLSGGSSIEIA